MTAADDLAPTGHTVAAARAAGMTEGRLRARPAPFRGVRAAALPASSIEQARAIASRLRGGQVLSGITAARLWGLPLPRSWAPSERPVIGVRSGVTRPRASDVDVHDLDQRLDTGMTYGMPVTGPAATALVLARSLADDDLVVVLDALLSPSDHYRELRLPRRPHATPQQLDAFLTRCKGIPGVVRARRCAVLARVGAEKQHIHACSRPGG